MVKLSAIIKNSDMPEYMQQTAIDMCEEGMKKYEIEKDIAGHIKKGMDKKYGGLWHCVVGQVFGSFVTHLGEGFLYFYLEQHAILLFRTA